MFQLTAPVVSSPDAGVFLLEVFIVLWRMRTVHRKLTVTDINDLGAGNVFTLTATAPCRLLNRIHDNFKIALVKQFQILAL